MKYERVVAHMAELSGIWQQIAAFFASLFAPPNWHNLLDIAIVTILIYQVIKVLSKTRSNAVLKGVGILIIVAWISELLQLNTMNWLLQQIIGTGAVLIVVLFQPEIRRGLESIGRSSFKGILSPLGTERVSVEGTVGSIISALSNLSRRRVGALIVFEMKTGLNDIARSGTILDAQISSALIENLFEPNTPLHDGALIVRKDRIAAAGCILQLSDDTSISRELGTRHRAALGVSESADAITLIVSEETGVISMARGGKLTRYLDAKSLSIILSEIYSYNKNDTIFDIFRRWREEPHEK